MSFIDKALERAKELRQKEGTATEQPPAPAPKVHKPLPVIGNLGYAESPKEICYSTTRSVPIDLDSLRRNLIIAEDNYPQVAEQYKILWTHILHKTKKDTLNTIMFTGPQPDEGKSLTVANVAMSIAQEVDQTVLIVDADLRNPSIHKYFGIPNNKGLTDFLKGGVPLPELLIHPEGIEKLVILPGGSPVSDAAELLKSPQMQDLVHELKHCYQDRYVLFDLPPIINYADALAFAPLVDCVVLVAEGGRTQKEDLEKCIELLQEFNVLGIVLNKVKETETKAYYYDSYGTDTANSKKRRLFG